jgi:hypothetical protein
MFLRNHGKFSFLITTALVLACAVPALVPASAPVVSTFDPNLVNTSIAQTANAAASQTARALPPTQTPTATARPTITATETSTPTFIFILATPTVPSSTPTPGNFKYDCRVESQSPADNSGMTKGADFDMIWHVTNIGTESWSSDDADYRFAGGDKLHKFSIYDLNESVSPGGQTDIFVDMRAPSDPGTYTTRWNITVGKNKFCTMKLTLIVN